MIQIYPVNNTNYEKNGDALLPSSASVHVILNGAWEAELTHPLDKEGRWKNIVEEAVVKMPSFNGDQLFRIKAVEKQDSGVTATMEPIFYDAMNDCFLEDIRPNGDNGQTALTKMLSPNNKYSASSNITKTATAYYQYVNFLEALNGDLDQSFIKRWGGEILFDNYTVIVNNHVGGDYGAELRYGKNIPKNGMTFEVDNRDVVTRIYPKAYEGRVMSNNGYVDSPLINNYPTVKAATITFENVKLSSDLQGDPEDTDIICDSQVELDQALTELCEAQFSEGLDKPKVTISVDMVLLQNTEQYKDVKNLEEVSLGDTVRIYNRHLGIMSEARIIELEYDAIRKKVSSVVIGDYEYNYFNDVSSATEIIKNVVNPDGTLMAERVQGILNGVYTQLRLQSTAAQKVDGVAFKVEELDDESPLYGCMIWGTQGIQISTTRTADGKDWDWTTAITAKGIVANAIITGLLSDKTGNNYWDLDTGEFRLSSTYVKIDGDNIGDYVDSTLTQQEVFNKLTNNGAAKGLYLTADNELYINATYIKTGIITDNIGNNYWNLATGEFRLSSTATVGGNAIATKNNTISNVDVEYASGTSNTTPPETGWSTNSPEWQDNRYIWQRTVTTMADGTQNISEPTCIQGAAGLGGESTTIISNTVDYAISDSGTVPPNDWLENIPPLQPGKYLWTRTVTEYSDGESSIAYGVSYQGENGTNGTDGINGTDGTDGIGIASSNVDYQVSDSGVTPPTGDWSDTVPDMEPGQFLWTRTQFTYTDGDVTTSYSVSYQGENGSQGVPGPPGEDGQTLYTWIKYADTPTSGMSDTPYGKKYLGIAYNKASPIESTNYSDYSWSDIKGKDGIPGTPGKNGQTLYTWIKYATSASGANMSDNPTGRDYIGIAYNKTTATESTNPYDYAWSLIQGEAGIGVKGIVEQYYLSNSSTTQTGGSWSTAQPAWQKGKYIWTRSQITWTDNSVTYTNPVLAKAINGANEAVDDLDTSLDQQEVFNRLTNNGRAQGIILQNGQLYINAEYIQSLILKVGGVNNENGTFEVYNGSGVLVGKIDKDGAKFTNGNDWLQIKNSLMTGGYGGTTDGLLDLSANYSGGERHVVLESKTGDVILKSSGDFLVERPGTGQGTLLQSGNYQYLTDVGDVEITSSETEELRAIALGESVAKDASNNPIDALALIRKDTLSKVFYEGDYFSYFSSHIITGWRFVSLTTPTTIAPGYTWDLTANASGSGIPYRTGTEYLVIPVSTGWGAVGSIDQPTSAYGQGSTNFTVTLLNNGSSAHTIGCTCLVLGLLSRDLSPLA